MPHECVIKKASFFSHFYSLAAESISKRQVAEALHKPTQLLCDVPTQTCIDAQKAMRGRLLRQQHEMYISPQEVFLLS